jgi:hypothetical protein
MGISYPTALLFLLKKSWKDEPDLKKTNLFLRSGYPGLSVYSLPCLGSEQLQKGYRISPYEMLYGLSFLGWPSGLPSFETKDQFLWNYVLSLSSVLSSLRHQGLLAQAPLLEFQAHPHHPRDYVLVRSWSWENLEANLRQQCVPLKEDGPTTHTQVKWAHKREHWAMDSKPGNTKVTSQRL